MKKIFFLFFDSQKNKPNMRKKIEKKYIFTLKNINIETVEKKYGISVISNINIQREDNPENITKIQDLFVPAPVVETVSFIDDSKNVHKCQISFINFDKQNINRQQYNCFWDRNPISKHVNPIGCPIKFIPTIETKSYYSEISKDMYTIKEQTSSKKEQCYLVDGVFCSFNCCMAYIQSQKKQSMYELSEMLLLKIYKDMFDDLTVISPAPHWRKLIEYGGNLTIDQFRSSFNKVEYRDHGVHIRFESIGHLHEENLKF
jgi:hypothetical protein